MSGHAESPVENLIEELDLTAVAAWLQDQRWYASKSRSVASLEIEESVALAGPPPLVLALVQARFATGSHDLYQLPLAFLPAAAGGRPHAADQRRPSGSCSTPSPTPSSCASCCATSMPRRRSTPARDACASSVPS